VDGSIGAVLGVRVAVAANRPMCGFRYDDARKQFVLVPIDLGAATDQVYLSLYATASAFRIPLRPGRHDRRRHSSGPGRGGPIPVCSVDQVNIGPLPRSLSGKARRTSC